MSGIEWMDKTRNPVRGCTKVSPVGSECAVVKDVEGSGRNLGTSTVSNKETKS